MSNGRRIAWMGHPYSGDPENLTRAKTWLRWLIRTFSAVDFAADWILWCEVLNDADPVERERGLVFDCGMIWRLDEYWIVGGYSHGVVAERDTALRLGKPVVDLVSLGPTPPASFDPARIADFYPRHRP